MATTFQRYKDLDISFRKNPVTKDITPLTDGDAIKRAVKLLVLTNYYDRPFHPEYGSNIYFHMFENFDPITIVSLRRAITEVIENFEPRAVVLAVDFTESNIDLNKLNCSITFAIRNMPDQLTVSFDLERVR